MSVQVAIDTKQITSHYAPVSLIFTKILLQQPGQCLETYDFMKQIDEAHNYINGVK